MVKRFLAVLLSAALLAPSAVLAQSKAGIVTTLEGTVTARRVALQVTTARGVNSLHFLLSSPAEKPAAGAIRSLRTSDPCLRSTVYRPPSVRSIEGKTWKTPSR